MGLGEEAVCARRQRELRSIDVDPDGYSHTALMHEIRWYALESLGRTSG
ncbi:hypothetical protein ACFSL6_00025 [Paenibacillus thailandensis]